MRNDDYVFEIMEKTLKQYVRFMDLYRETKNEDYLALAVEWDAKYRRLRYKLDYAV